MLQDSGNPPSRTQGQLHPSVGCRQPGQRVRLRERHQGQQRHQQLKNQRKRHRLLSPTLTGSVRLRTPPAKEACAT